MASQYHSSTHSHLYKSDLSLASMWLDHTYACVAQGIMQIFLVVIRDLVVMYASPAEAFATGIKNLDL